MQDWQESSRIKRRRKRTMNRNFATRNRKRGRKTRLKRRGEKEREEKTDLSENAAWKQEKKTMARIQYK